MINKIILKAVVEYRMWIFFSKLYADTHYFPLNLGKEYGLATDFICNI